MQNLDEFLRTPTKEGKTFATEQMNEENKDHAFEPSTLKEFEFYLLGVGYDGKKSLAYAKLYDVDNKKIFFWYDNTNHKPYCLSKKSVEELEKNNSLTSHSGFDHFETIEKYLVNWENIASEEFGTVDWTGDNLCDVINVAMATEMFASLVFQSPVLGDKKKFKS